MGAAMEHELQKKTLFNQTIDDQLRKVERQLTPIERRLAVQVDETKSSRSPSSSPSSSIASLRAEVAVQCDEALAILRPVEKTLSSMVSTTATTTTTGGGSGSGSQIYNRAMYSPQTVDVLRERALKQCFDIDEKLRPVEEVLQNMTERDNRVKNKLLQQISDAVSILLPIESALREAASTEKELRRQIKELKKGN